MKYKFIAVLLVFFHTFLLFAQADSTPTQKILQSTNTLKNAYTQNDNYAIAKSYEKIGTEYFQNKDFAKAEINFLKAKELYVKLSKKQDKKRVSRLLAQAQEAQNKIENAIQNYEDASDGEFKREEPQPVTITQNAPSKKPAAPPSPTEISSNTESPKDGDGINNIGKSKNPEAPKTLTGEAVGFDKDINQNDANRLKNNTNSTIQTGYLQSNIGILEKEAQQNPAAKEELSNSYKQLGDLQFKENKLPEAIQNYSNAFTNATSGGSITFTGNQLSNAYLATGQFTEAISVQEKILTTDVVKKDANLTISQIQNLANIYTQKNEEEKALSLLQNSYDLALKTNNTIQAKNSVEQMIEIYNKKGDINKSISLSKSFLDTFEKIILNDSLLLDKKILEATGEKITQLENEKALKDELIKKKNTFNYFLIGASLLLFLMLFLISRSLYHIKIKNKKIELQSLRREMNPHFVFNSLNSINQFIAQNNELEANKYLSSYSNLMRSIMENSNKDFIPLSTELELLKRYLDLEKLRFSDKFDYTISVDELIDTDAIQIPNMIIQPHVENAIWHGLRYKETKGLLQLSFVLHDNLLIIKVEDNGIGLTESKAIKTRNQQQHKSIGISNTQNRIDILNKLYQKKIECKLTELAKPSTGTVVKISYQV